MAAGPSRLLGRAGLTAACACREDDAAIMTTAIRMTAAPLISQKDLLPLENACDIIYVRLSRIVLAVSAL